MASSKEMTVGKPLTLIFSFTLPLLLGNVLQQTYSLIDAAIVGKFLGPQSLAAISSSFNIVNLILLIAFHHSHQKGSCECHLEKWIGY